MNDWQPGWYPDEYLAGMRRYWNGDAWTDYRVDAEGVPVNKVGKRARRRKLPKWKLAPEVGMATLRAVFRDKWVIPVLLLGSFTTLLVSMAVGLVFIGLGAAAPKTDSFIGTVGTLAVVAVGVGITQLYVSVVVAAAWTRAQGGEPTLRSSLRIVWARRRQLLAWALVSMIVIVIMKLIERWGLVGLIAGFVGEIAWSVASIFALPVVVVEGTMPLATLKRSGTLFKDNIGFSLGYTVGFALLRLAFVLPFLVVSTLLVVFGIAGLTSTGGVPVILASGVGILLAVVIFAALIGISAAFSQYLNFAVFRLATEESVPGLDPRLLPPRLPGPITGPMTGQITD